MAFVEDWDVTTPAYDEDRRLGDDRIRELKRGLVERLAIGHYWYTDESGNDDIGYHKPVAAIVNSGLAANKPSSEATGRVLGHLYWESDTGKLVKWNSVTSAWDVLAGYYHGTLVATYSAEDVDVTLDSPTVTGNSTEFVTYGVAAGDVLQITGQTTFYEIKSVDSETQLTLGIAGGADRNYAETTAGGAAYTIYFYEHSELLRKSGGTISWDLSIGGTLAVTGATTLTGATTHGADVAMGGFMLTGLAAGAAAGNSVRYEQLIGAYPLIAHGEYTGDGNNTQAVTGVGFEPVFMLLYDQVATGSNMHCIIKCATDGTKSRGLFSASQIYADGYIVSLDSDGFTVGSASTKDWVNYNARKYTYICLGLTPS